MTRIKNSVLLGAVLLMLPIIASAEVITDDGPARAAKAQAQSFDGGKSAAAPAPVTMPAADEASKTAEEVKKSAQSASSAAARLKGVLNGLATNSRTPCCIGGSKDPKQDCKVIEAEDLTSDTNLVKKRMYAFDKAMEELIANAGAVINGVQKYRRLTNRSPDVDLGAMDTALQRVAGDYKALKEKARSGKATSIEVVLGDRLTSQEVDLGNGETPLLVMKREGLSVRSIVNLDQMDYLKTSLEKLATEDLSKAPELAPVPVPAPYLRRYPHGHWDDCHLFMGGRCWPMY